jgi:exodeoxyribonuclease VII small subunit
VPGRGRPDGGRGMSDQPRPVEELRFSEALAELEAIVAALEGGQLDLEEGLARYERGVALLRTSQAKLAEAEQRVTMLMGELDTSEAEE